VDVGFGDGPAAGDGLTALAGLDVVSQGEGHVLDSLGQVALRVDSLRIIGLRRRRQVVRVRDSNSIGKTGVGVPWMGPRASPASLYGTTAVARDIVGAVAAIWGGRIKAKVWWCDAGGGKEFRQGGRATVVPGRGDDLPGRPICDRYIVRLDASKHSTFGCAKQIILKFRFRQLRYFVIETLDGIDRVRNSGKRASTAAKNGFVVWPLFPVYTRDFTAIHLSGHEPVEGTYPVAYCRLKIER
jgi:hypothetical protein